MKSFAPARDVRNSERNKLLKDFRQRMFESEPDFLKQIDLQRIFLHLIDKQLALSHAGISGTDLCEIPWEKREKALKLFAEIMRDLKAFERSPDEGRMLLAKLLVITANEIARTPLSILQAEEFNDPVRILRARSPMTPLPMA